MKLRYVYLVCFNIIYCVSVMCAKLIFDRFGLDRIVMHVCEKFRTSHDEVLLDMV